MYSKIRTALLEAITEKGTEWGDISSFVEGRKIKVTNWLVVRGVLSDLIDEGLVHRNNDKKQGNFTKKLYKQQGELNLPCFFIPTVFPY